MSVIFAQFKKKQYFCSRFCGMVCLSVVEARYFDGVQWYKGYYVRFWF